MTDSAQSVQPLLEAIFEDLLPGVQRVAGRGVRRQRRRRLAACAVALMLMGGTAVAGVSVLGSPAPESVRSDIAAVDRGMPADLRLNPDVQSAHAVAASDHSVVYFASLRDGGYCTELVTGDGPRGAVCSDDASSPTIGVTVPYTDPVTDSSPITVSGRVTAAGSKSVELVYPDGGHTTAALGQHGFYVADVPTAHLQSAHRGGIAVIARDGDGKPLAQRAIPADAITPPSEAQRPHDPIELDTVSDSHDFTLVLGVRGTVDVADARSMRLRYSDGTEVTIPLRRGRFDYPVPKARQKSFMEPATLSAVSADGRSLSERPVAAVAWWRAHQG